VVVVVEEELESLLRPKFLESSIEKNAKTTASPSAVCFQFPPCYLVALCSSCCTG
jgi:hypothetical protein